ncbi:hypothetical protein GGR92_000852 [Spirosoma lacussanchae]|uniref:hypothetical protein n=1 Tax=Spirosoma lacussanchae TaxID=1884249 RepID=UPI001108EDB9|nr:hypothetical protein [Spirosoma lacussanchae]
MTSQPPPASLLNLAPLLTDSRVFRGGLGNPFLAPRGVWLAGSKLFVADTGQNRVFIWHRLPKTEFAEPDLVLGQPDSADTGRNAGGSTGAGTLQYPSGLWSDGERLVVADAWNHRVLIWLSFPTYSGQPADVVLGQPAFSGNQPNVGSIGTAPSAQSLNWPYGVFSDGERLWIADTGNRRVLFYEQMPTESFARADGVIGKPDFTGRDYENREPVWPYSVRVGPDGQLAIADTQYYRTLLWNDWHSAFTQPADALVGQPDFEANGQNQFRLSPEQHTLSWTYDAFFYQKGLFVADTGNSRLLWFERVPCASNPLADGLIGHANFQTGSENGNTRFGTDRQLYWPFSICIDGDCMAIADTGNHRVVLGWLGIS